MTVTIREYVVDTGYLVEIFRVDKLYTEESYQRIKAKFSEAIERGDRLYVPLPVLFEVANHIAGVANGTRRRELVNKFLADVSSSVKDTQPWTITPPGDPQSIEELMGALGYSVNRFADEFSEQRIGLTDTIVIMEAERLKLAHSSSKLKQYLVHIWTRDEGVKAREPDTEPNPFV